MKTLFLLILFLLSFNASSQMIAYSNSHTSTLSRKTIYERFEHYIAKEFIKPTDFIQTLDSNRFHIVLNSSFPYTNSQFPFYNGRITYTLMVTIVNNYYTVDIFNLYHLNKNDDGIGLIMCTTSKNKIVWLDIKNKSRMLILDLFNKMDKNILSY